MSILSRNVAHIRLEIWCDLFKLYNLKQKFDNKISENNICGFIESKGGLEAEPPVAGGGNILEVNNPPLNKGDFDLEEGGLLSDLV